MGYANQRPAEISSRCLGYALRAIKLYQFLQARKDGAAWVISKQYLRSATSIGANVAEAQSAESRSDFIHKYGVAQKETRESLYWLRLLAESGLGHWQAALAANERDRRALRHHYSDHCQIQTKSEVMSPARCF